MSPLLPSSLGVRPPAPAAEHPFFPFAVNWPSSAVCNREQWYIILCRPGRAGTEPHKTQKTQKTHKTQKSKRRRPWGRKRVGNEADRRRRRRLPRTKRATEMPTTRGCRRGVRRGRRRRRRRRRRPEAPAPRRRRRGPPIPSPGGTCPSRP